MQWKVYRSAFTRLKIQGYFKKITFSPKYYQIKCGNDQQLKNFVLNNTGKLFSSGENFDTSHKLKHNFCQLIWDWNWLFSIYKYDIALVWNLSILMGLWLVIPTEAGILELIRGSEDSTPLLQASLFRIKQRLDWPQPPRNTVIWKVAV